MTDLPENISSLAAELTDILGERGVTTELRAREKASADGSYLSPIITEQLPLGLADIVAFPTTAEQVAQVVAAAVRHGVGITPRGKGTGNYGQAIPIENGLVLDLSKLRGVVEVGNGFLTALAGTPIVTIEQAARESGQQMAGPTGWPSASTGHTPPMCPVTPTPRIRSPDARAVTTSRMADAAHRQVPSMSSSW